MPKTIALVACVKKKNNSAKPAKELYCSDWFKKASAYANRFSDEWFILSAKYGLIPPHKIIEPYCLTLKKMTQIQKREWADNVISNLESILHSGDVVIFLAGIKYRENLIKPIQEMDCKVEIPMEGLSFGDQLSWLKSRLG